MTSQQLRAKLDEALAIIAQCDRLLDDPYTQERHWELVHLKRRVNGFMDLHRQQLTEGGAE